MTAGLIVALGVSCRDQDPAARGIDATSAPVEQATTPPSLVSTTASADGLPDGRHDVPVVEGGSFGFEWATYNDTDHAVSDSNAVVRATMTELSAAYDVGPAAAGFRELVFFQAFRVDEVLAGTGVEPGEQYAFQVSAGRLDGEVVQFREDPLPMPGAEYVLLLRVPEHESRVGVLTPVGVGTGRFDLATAEANGLLSHDYSDVVLPTTLDATPIDSLPTLDEWLDAVSE